MMRFELERAFEILERTPGTLSALLSGLSDAWALENEGADTFTPRDVVAHLVTGEEVDWVERAEIILKDGVDRPFTPFDRFAFRERYQDLSVLELLDRFGELRLRNLERVRELDIGPEQLELEGTHPELGTVRLRQLLAAWVVHDLGHVRQIVRVMAKQYREEVGPWTAYLRVLDE